MYSYLVTIALGRAERVSRAGAYRHA